MKAFNEDNPEVGWSDIESDKCIYFPADGTQPTTKEAVEYSCANVNDDAITNWYMMMFGILGIGETTSSIDIVHPKIAFINFSGEKSVDYILGGFCKEKLCRVISPASQWIDPTQRADFVRDFKTIASSSVGRVLLYRILIEIRRYIPNTEACQEKN